METAEFETSLAVLMDRATTRQVAVMCAEALWWQCHRQILADALAGRGVSVEHILSETRREPHRITPYARLEGGRVRYPGIMGA